MRMSEYYKRRKKELVEQGIDPDQMQKELEAIEYNESGIVKDSAPAPKLIIRTRPR